MSKSVSANLLTHLASETTTLAYLLTLTRTDGGVKRFTTHDEDIAYGGFTYESSASYSATAVQTTAGLEVDNLDAEILLDAAGITEADLLAGIYDHATIEVFQVNYQDLSQGQLTLRTGRLGKFDVQRGVFTAEVRGLTQYLQQTIGRVYGKRCNADLGDSRCTVNLAAHTVTGTVTVATSRQVFTASSVPATAGGLCTFTSGSNAGFKQEVKSISGSVITLNLALPYDLQIGDGFSVHSGCDKLHTTCRDTFNNLVHFRGYGLYIPGQDRVLQYPDSHA